MSEDLAKVGAQALAGFATEADEDEVVERLDLTPEQAVETREQKKARYAQVLSRGIINDKLQSLLTACVPAGRRGKFVLDNSEEIIRYKNLGYTFEYVEGVGKVHGDTDGLVRVGDLVLMTISEDDASILQEVRADSIRRKLGLARNEYMERASVEAQRGGAIPINESRTEIRRGNRSE